MTPKQNAAFRQHFLSSLPLSLAGWGLAQVISAGFGFFNVKGALFGLTLVLGVLTLVNYVAARTVVK